MHSVRLTLVAVEKIIIITYSECVSVALLIQHAMSVRTIVLLSVACMAVPDFLTLFHKRPFFLRGGGVVNS